MAAEAAASTIVARIHRDLLVDIISSPWAKLTPERVRCWEKRVV
jgi:hypothetical protein